MTLAMWLITLWAALVPVIALALRRLELRRDTFFLLVYLQALVYVDVAPILATTDVNAATVDRYTWVQAWALVLFQIPLVVIYSLMIDRRRRKLPSDRVFRLSPTRLGVFIVGSSAFGIAYFVVATSYGLLYRRLGEDLSVIQLSMSLFEFAIYRAFIELGPFLMAVQLLLLRMQTDMSSRLRLWSWVGFALTSALFMAFALINSRLTAVMTLA